MQSFLAGTSHQKGWEFCIEGMGSPNTLQIIFSLSAGRTVGLAKPPVLEFPCLPFKQISNYQVFQMDVTTVTKAVPSV